MGISLRVSLVLAATIAISPACADTKINKDVDTALQESERVRVLVVTRPDPDLPNGGPAIANPTAYLSARLGQAGAGIQPIGRLPVALAELDRGAIERLRADPNVAMVVRDIPVPPVLFETVPLIRADAFHGRQRFGADTTVVVLDTGIEASHAAFSGSVVAQACFSTAGSTIYRVSSLCPNGLNMSLLPDAAEGCPPQLDECSHGTHVAGIVAGHDMVHAGARFSGVAPRARVLPVQVFSLFDDARVCIGGTPCVLSFTSDQMRALEWVYRYRERFNIAAVNMSLGGGYSDKYCDSTSPLTEIIDRLKYKGVLTVIAAGNSGFYDGVSEPACISGAIAVSAMNKQGAIDVSYSNVAQIVDIVAPGTAVVSSVRHGQFAALTGTSMAAPHVAGAVALMREMHPTLSAFELEEKLKQAGGVVSDPRTGMKLRSLELPLSDPLPAMNTVAAGPDSPPQEASASEPVAVSGSFIVQTPQSGSDPELVKNLNEGCTNVDCTVRRIGERSYAVEVTPKPDLTPDQRRTVTISKESLQSILKGATVYDNKSFAPNMPMTKF